MKLNFICILLLINFLCKTAFGSEKDNKVITTSEDNPGESIEKEYINKRKFHIVQEGDTISSLSRIYALDKNFIIKINQLKDENYIFVGQTLKLTENQSSNLNVQNKTIPKYHKILEGENLTEISNRYGININDLINLNNLNNPDNIEVGTNILLMVPSENIELKATSISKTSNSKSLTPKQYGPLTVESTELEFTGRRKTLNVINKNKVKLILSLKCETKEIDVRKKGRKWKGWMPVKEKFEENLINDFC